MRKTHKAAEWAFVRIYVLYVVLYASETIGF